MTPPETASSSKPLIPFTADRHSAEAAPYWTVVRESPYGGEVRMTSKRSVDSVPSLEHASVRTSASSMRVEPKGGLLERSSPRQYRRRRSSLSQGHAEKLARAVGSRRCNFQPRCRAYETSRTVALRAAATTRRSGSARCMALIQVTMRSSSRQVSGGNQSTLRPSLTSIRSQSADARPRANSFRMSDTVASSACASFARVNSHANGLTSKPTRREAASAATRSRPEPQNGSRTRAPHSTCSSARARASSSATIAG